MVKTCLVGGGVKHLAVQKNLAVFIFCVQKNQYINISIFYICKYIVYGILYIPYTFIFHIYLYSGDQQMCPTFKFFNPDDFHFN